MFHLLSFAGNCVFWFGAVLPIRFLCACPSSSQTPYRSLSVQARKVRSFRCSSSPQKVSRLFGGPLARGVAVLALLRSSHSHICLGNGYSVVEVHGGSLEAPLTFPLPNFFRIFPLLFKFFSFKLVNYKKPSLCRAFSKFPSLGRQREGQKINPLEKFFCFGSKLEPFFVYGIKIDAIKISACLFSEADAHFSYSVFTVAAGSAAH